MAKLEGKVALITGAAVGLGEGISTAYAKYGAKLIMVDLSPAVEETAERLRKEYGAEIITVVANVADRAAMDAAAAKGVEKFGEINVACCNAGVCRLAPFEEMTDEMRDFHIDVNIKGVWNTCKAVVPYMLKQGGGSIVIASSVTGDIVADAGEAAYATTKAALVGLTKCLAVEYAKRNIRVNCSQLGYARTPMVEKMAVESNPENPEAAINDIAANVPMGRLARPIEVGELFAFLGSDESSYLTGAQIVIDGGATLPEKFVKIVNKYEHDDIEVVLEAYGSDFDTKLSAGMGSGDTPDVVYMWNYPAYADGLEPLDEYIDKEGEEYKDNFYSTLWNYNSFDDTTYGIPVGFTTHALFYNKDLFAEAGVEEPTDSWTWSDLQTAAKTIEEKTGQKGFAFQMKPDPYDFEMYLWSNGAACGFVSCYLYVQWN